MYYTRRSLCVAATHSRHNKSGWSYNIVNQVWRFEYLTVSQSTAVRSGLMGSRGANTTVERGRIPCSEEAYGVWDSGGVEKTR